MTSKSSYFSTASSYASISVALSLVSLICSEVEGLTEDLESRPIPRKVAYHPENSSLVDQKFQRVGLGLGVHLWTLKLRLLL